MRFRGIASAPAIERFLRLIRACCAYEEHFRFPFEGTIECDESSLGGHRRRKRGWGATGKIVVFGILKRNGLIQAFPVQGRSSADLIGLIRERTRPGSLYYTDDWHTYASLAIRGDHIVIRKDLGRPIGITKD